MDRTWITRDYLPGDEQGIIDLWKQVFFEGEQERAELDYWYWQFRDNPAGFGKIRLAVDGDHIVGHYAVVPMQIYLQGKPVDASLSLDTMTHADYRRQGMFERLANELYADLGQQDIGITYGFPNNNSLGGFVRKLEWTHICSLPVYVKPLRSAVIAGQVISNRLLASIAKPLAGLAGSLVFRSKKPPEKFARSLRWLERFDASATALWDRVYDPNKIAIKRSAEYLNWRYFQNPARDYHALAFQENGELLGYAVLRSVQQFGLRGGMITELIALPGREDVSQALLDAASQYFISREIDLIACLAHGDGRLTSLLRRNRFLLPPRQFDFKEWYFGGRTNNAAVAPQLINDPDSWYLTFGDTDII
jgi:hypothetical protein